VRHLFFLVLSVPLSLGGCAPRDDSATDADGFLLTAREADQSPAMIFVAEPARVRFGDTVSLRWQARADEVCVASGGWQGTRSPVGEEITDPLREDTDFLLSCTAGARAALHKVHVTVEDITPDVEFAAGQERISANGTTTLHWNAEGARRCRASGGWQGDLPTSGTWRTKPLNRSTSFYLTCVSEAGTALSSITVGVLPQTRART